MIEHELLFSTTIGAALAKIRRKLLIPSAVMALQRRPFAPLDLRWHRPLGSALQKLRDVCSAAPRQKPADIASRFLTSAAAPYPSAIAAVHSPAAW